ncbi:MAG: hypothetical protein IT379_13775 [Deltaproteobacteria bacterium]|nr:hypothetical protein [Deltaproteobacteria bacterium]
MAPRTPMRSELVVTLAVLLAATAAGCAASNGDTQGRDAMAAADSGPRDAAGDFGGLDAHLPDATGSDTAPPEAAVGDAGSDGETDAAAEDARTGTAQICDTCRDDGDCAIAHQCVSLTSGGQACVPECVPDLPSCARDFECLVDLTSGADGPVCLPVGGPCCLDLDDDDYGQGIGCDGRDCDDSDALINPGMPDLCNGMDDNCNDLVDEGSPERCDNDADDDCDGVSDCADGECAGTPCGDFGRICTGGFCACPSGDVEDCRNGRDDDCDGAMDCADPGCNGAICDAAGRTCIGGFCGCAGGGTESACADGLDNDCDGMLDCADANCNLATCGAGGRVCIGSTCTCPGGGTETSCGNGTDDDCDAMTDCADPDCTAMGCGTFGRTCSAGTCRCPGGDAELACSDTTDNDCDGMADCADVDCAGRSCDARGRICAAGACSCPSSTELCNGTDDDCDGTVDEGCPNGLIVAAPTAGTTFGGGGGDPFTDLCAVGSVLVGIAGRSGARVDQIQPICAQLLFETDASTTPERTFRIRRGPVTFGLQHGGGGGTAFDDRCAGDDVVISMAGRSGSEIDQIGIECGRLTIERSGATWVVRVTSTGFTPARGGTGGGPFTFVCPSPGAGAGLAGRAAARLDQITLYCSALGLSTS